MPDLADLLRDGMTAAVDGLSPSAGFDERVRDRVRRRTRTRRVATATGMALVVAVAAAGAGALSLAGSAGPSVVAGPAGRPSVGDDLFLLADPAPDGFAEPWLAGGRDLGVAVDVEVTPGWDRTLRFVDFDEEGEHPVRVLDVQWGPAGIGGRSVAPGESAASPGSESLTEAAARAATGDLLTRLRAEAGVAAVTVRDRAGVASAAGGWLVWSEDDGSVVRVAGHDALADAGGASPTPLDGALLAAVAESLVPREGPGFDLPDPPEGFEAVAEWPGIVPSGTDSRLAVYERAADAAVVHVLVSEGPGVPPEAGLVAADARRLEVRGNEAVLAQWADVEFGLLPADGVPPRAGELAVRWTEPGGEQVTVAGVGVDEDELVSVARSLVAVDEATWVATASGGAGGAGGAAIPVGGVDIVERATDEVAAVPVAPQATLPPPPPRPAEAETPAGVERISGSYTGTENYTHTDGRCPDLDHVLEATLSLAGGAVWQYRGDYCGDLDGSLWSGTGTFTLTTPEGDTVTGTSDVGWLEVPTAGRPFMLTITGGTGRYDGATGACELDDTITQVVAGVQDHTGTFVCVLAP